MKRWITLALCLALLMGAGSLAEGARIYLYGEQHAQEAILEAELALWQGYYAEGMRHLFVEMAYYSAEFLNLWMRGTGDAPLETLYAEWAGTMLHAPVVLAFYKEIKRTCPETVFHGTDVGHQHSTTGERYLRHLRREGLADSEAYARTKEVIAQGERYYAREDDAYREEMMAENFAWAYDALDGARVMGIYGGAHVGLDALDVSGTVPSMAAQLAARYGDAVRVEYLTHLTLLVEPLRMDEVTVGGVTWAAAYFGEQDLRGLLPRYASRTFWRLEGAYEAFADAPLTGDVLPYDNYPMQIEPGQAFLVEYTGTDGSVTRLFYRADGTLWQGRPTTVGVEMGN